MAATAEGDDVDNGCGGGDGSWLGFGGEEAESEGIRERPGARSFRPGVGAFAKKTQTTSINPPDQVLHRWRSKPSWQQLTRPS